MNPRIVHIDLTAFFVSVERILNPQWIGKPIMVAGSSEHRGVVTCASYEVRPYGVRAGMATAAAQRLCPHAIRVDSHHEAYWEYSSRVRKFLKNYAPEFETASVDEFYMNWTGCEKLFGGDLLAFAKTLQQSILDQFGLPCAMAIASNKTVAKIGCDHAKPAGVIEILTGNEAQFLSPLPVQVLPGVGAVMLEQLHRYDIRTCGQLAALTPEGAEMLFGEWGAHLRQSASGHGSTEIAGSHEQKQISAEETFSKDSRDIRFLHEKLHAMSQEVSETMRLNDLKARCVHLKLRYANWETLTRQTTLEGTFDPVVIFKTAKLLLEKADEKKLPIRLIGIGVSKWETEDGNLNLFGDNRRRDSLLKTVDAINQKFDHVVKIGVVK